MAESRANMWRNRRRLILIFLLFFAPTLLAWLLVLGGWRPAGANHHGVLIQPPVPIADWPLIGANGTAVDQRLFDGLWSMLLVTEGGCEDDCVYTLDRMMRIRIALNKDAARVRLLLVLPAGVSVPPTLPADLMTLQLPPTVIAGLTEGAAADASSSTVHLVDPYGFRMMRYSTPLDAQGLLKDLRRLLRLSNQDIERARRAGVSDD